MVVSFWATPWRAIELKFRQNRSHGSIATARARRSAILSGAVGSVGGCSSVTLRLASENTAQAILHRPCRDVCSETLLPSSKVMVTRPAPLADSIARNRALIELKRIGSP
jgi:hypothetical protein